MSWELRISAPDLDLVQYKLGQSIGRTARDRPHMDGPAFHDFYEQTCRPLFGYLLRVAGERAQAEDIFQEAYCRFLGAELPPMNEAQRRSYLFRIATNLLRDRWRRVQEVPIPEQIPDTEALGTDATLRFGVRQALQRLSLRERQLLWLAYVEGCNHKEIADSTGVKAASVKLLLFRARRKLADLIREPRRSGSEVEV